jgi:hypothetical protein
MWLELENANKESVVRSLLEEAEKFAEATAAKCAEAEEEEKRIREAKSKAFELEQERERIKIKMRERLLTLERKLARARRLDGVAANKLRLASDRSARAAKELVTKVKLVEDAKKSQNIISDAFFKDGRLDETAIDSKATALCEVLNLIDVGSGVSIKPLEFKWTTCPIYIRVPGGVTETCFGKFQVHMHLLQGQLEVRISRGGGNVSRNGCLTPHVQESGPPCLGNVGPFLVDALKEVNIARAIFIINEYLCIYNAASPHSRLSEWEHNTIDSPPCRGCGRSLEYADEVCGSCFACVVCSKVTDKSNAAPVQPRFLSLNISVCSQCMGDPEKVRACAGHDVMKSGIVGTKFDYSNMFQDCELGLSVSFCDFYDGSCHCASSNSL